MTSYQISNRTSGAFTDEQSAAEGETTMTTQDAMAQAAKAAVLHVCGGTQTTERQLPPENVRRALEDVLRNKQGARAALRAEVSYWAEGNLYEPTPRDITEKVERLERMARRELDRG